MSANLFSKKERELLENIMLLRRDVRGNNFLSTPVSNQDLQHILQSAAMAPSVGFSQPWRFVIVRDSSVKQQITDCFDTENMKAAHLFTNERQRQYMSLKLEGIMEAPINIAVYYQSSEQPVLGQTSMPEMGEYSVVCAVQNMWLMARALNLGIGWVSILNPSKVNQVLKAPPEHKLVAYLCLGHVKQHLSEPELETLAWEKRKQLATLVFDENFDNSFD